MTEQTPLLIQGYGGSCALNMNDNDEYQDMPSFSVH